MLRTDFLRIGGAEMKDTQRTQINCNIKTNPNQVTPYSCESIELSSEKRRVSQEQLQHEYDYFLAQQLLESMLKNNLITVDEFNRITTLNRKSFSPALAQIMPRNP
ncbi:MAG: hypothetical protein PHC39_12805 [Proteiniphilum sp.]|nr:hypothetical protein [Proteiniphilum sp.]